MKVASHLLRRYTEIPQEVRALRNLLDDVGIEVKRIEPLPQGAVFTVELLANRGDHYCYAGVAREISGRTGQPVQLPEVVPLETGPSPIPLRNLTPRCLVYTATLLERLEPVDQLPTDALGPLHCAGIHSVTPPVDATNLSNLELGQPTHVFDADKVAGAIVVRESIAGERAWPLFTDAHVELPEGTLVIADEEKILAVAGVIGCEDSKATPASRRIVIESATFDPVAVRKASRALGIHTDASARFERGADPTMPLVGAGRVAWLLERHGGWHRVGPSGVVGSWVDENRQIPLDVADAAGFLEHPLTAAEVADRLGRYGFAVSGLYPNWEVAEGWEIPASLEGQSRDRLRNKVLVRVPPHRLWDVEYEADLVEELAKSIGYNETPMATPEVDMGAVPSPQEQVREAVSSVLVAEGFLEVFTDGFYGRDLRERAGIGEGHPLFEHVQTLNALERGYSLLKNNALLQAVLAVAANLAMRHDEIKAFEWTRTFHPDPEAENGVCTERRLVWAIACGHDRQPSWARDARPADPIFLKGVLREIAVRLSLDLRLGPADPALPLSSLLHDHRQGAVLLGGKPVGILGEVHPALLRELKIKRERPVYLEIEAEALETPGTPQVFVEPSEHHPIVRNLAFTLPPRLPAGEVGAHMSDCGPPWLRSVDVVDLFEHEEEGVPLRTVTYELVYEMAAEGRTAEEVNSASEYLVKAVEARFGERGVRLR